MTGQSAERELVLSQIEKKGNEAYDSLSDSERVDVLKGLLTSWTGADARESERELQAAKRLEEKLDEYVTTHRLA